MVVVGMGKLGGGELNVSSDIDLIYLYPEEGDTDGPRKPLTNHEFFIRLGSKLTAALSENTADGYVFRVDLRLRPWGDSGPLAMSFAMLEDYLVAQGRPWERYAWIKARPLTGTRHDELMQIVRPFVFRKYLDFDAFAAIRDLHVQIRREVARRDMQHNVKLGPGGIREIEFTAQVFQLIRGGQIASLRQRPTLTVLAELAKSGLMTADAQQELSAAYDFLRRLEHRLQYLDDAQTQLLPDDAESQAMLAEAMGFPDYAALLAALDRHRTQGHAPFRAGVRRAANRPEQPSAHRRVLRHGGCRHHPRAAGKRRLRRPRKSAGHARRAAPAHRAPAPNRPSCGSTSCCRPRSKSSAASPIRWPTLERFAALLQAIARRSTYLALLGEYPAALRQLVRLLAASPWAAQLITRQPQLLDELIAPQHLMQLPDWAQLARNCTPNSTPTPATPKRRWTRCAASSRCRRCACWRRTWPGRLTLEALSDHLSYLADTLLAETLARCWAGLKTRHRDSPRFAVIGYGKLGGKELGYASDLDLVFLYDDDDARAQEIYARLAQRINTWLGTLTSAGMLYETDLRLRPDGASGLLVSSTAAFRDYQLHHAWTWEHQALTRARFVCGDAAIGADVRGHPPRGAVPAARRRQAARRSAGDARKDACRPPQRQRTVRPQARQRRHRRRRVLRAVSGAGACPRASRTGDNVGNIALLQTRRRGSDWLPAELAQAAADAYRELRRRQHAIKLSGAEHARVAADSLDGHPAAVRALWHAIFHGRQPD